MSPIVEIRDLHVRFKGERNVYALNGVDISLAQGEVLGLLGESGSGKSVTLRALLRMLPPPSPFGSQTLPRPPQRPG